MKALIWKELRALRAPALITLGLLCVSVPVHVIYLRTQQHAYGGPMSFWWMVLPLLSLALGCYVIARDRARGELAFGSSWPASKSQVWSAKLIAGLVLLGVAYGLVAYLSAWADTKFFYANMMDTWWQGVPWLLLHASGCFMLFGMGFMVSGIRTAPFDAVLVTVLALGFVGLLLGYLLVDVIGHFWGPQLGIYVTDATFPVALSCIGAIVLGGICIAASAAGAVSGVPMAFAKRQWRTVVVWAALGTIALPTMLVGVRLFGEPGEEDICGGFYAHTTPDGRYIRLWEPVHIPTEMGTGFHMPRMWVMRADGTELRCISRWPAWLLGSLNQRWVLFWWGSDWLGPGAWPRTGALWLWDHSEQRLRRLALRLPGSVLYPEELRAMVSGSGRYLYVKPYILDLWHGLEVLAARVPVAGETRGLGWSEDERSFYWTQRRENGKVDVWAMDLPEGTNMRKVASSLADEGGWARLSRDARWLAWQFYGKRTGSEEPPPEYVKLERLEDGRGLLFEDARMTASPWSPDGEHFWVRAGDGVKIVRLPEARVVRTLGAQELEGRASGQSMRWSPDGNRVTFVSTKDLEPDKEREEGPHRLRRTLWVAKPDGSDLKRVAQTGALSSHAWECAGWTEDGKVVVVEDQRTIVAIDPDTLERTVIFEATGAKGADR